MSSGYDRATIIRNFSEILQTSNKDIAFQVKPPDSSFKVALVTKLHPALPNLHKLLDRFYPVISTCSLSAAIFPRNSLITATRKLPTLSAILTGNPFSSPPKQTSQKGFHKTPGCNCKVCKEGFFTSIISSPNNPRGFSLPMPVSCKVSHCVYVISCPCGLQYVGRTDGISPRWANHKSHIRKSRLTCNLAKHCVRYDHDMLDSFTSSVDIQQHLQFTILEAGAADSLEMMEETWRNRLQTWAPNGLNVREDGPDKLRNKTIHISSN